MLRWYSIAGAAEGEDGEVFAALADIIGRARYGDGLVGGQGGGAARGSFIEYSVVH